MNILADSLRNDLKNKYPAVATVSLKDSILPDGTVYNSIEQIGLNELMILLDSDNVKAYNVTLQVGELREGDDISVLPGDNDGQNDLPLYIEASVKIPVNATGNISLTRQFFGGDSSIIRGRLFNEEEMRGGSRSIVISEYTAEKYGIDVNDNVVYYMPLSNVYISYKVVGIYHSEKGIISAFIPLYDYFRDISELSPNNAYIDNAVATVGKTSRIDILLDSPESGEKYIKQMMQSGLDMRKYEIRINDMQYKTVVKSLDNICIICDITFVSVLSVCIGIFVILTMFYSFSRKKEAYILTAIGMKKIYIRVILFCEIVILSFIGVCAAFPAGIIGTDIISHFAQEEIHKKSHDEALNRTAENTQAKSMTLYRDMEFSLTDGYNGLNEEIFLHIYRELSEEEVGERFEYFWTEDEKIFIKGVTDSDISGFENAASQSDSICSEKHRKMGYAFECFAPVDSGYEKGDIVRIYSQKTKEHSYASITYEDIGNEESDSHKEHLKKKVSFSDSAKSEYYLVVIGTYERENNGDGEEDFIMAMEELELLCDYGGASGSSYGERRYDKISRRD